MKSLTINKTDFEIFRSLLKRNNLPTPLDYVVLNSKKLSSISYNYIRSRIDRLSLLNMIEVRKERPLQIRIIPELEEKITKYVMALIEIEEYLNKNGGNENV